MRSRMVVLALALAAPGAASAFCGMYVGPVGSSVENGASRIVVARDSANRTTTLTMANDVRASTTDFAMLVPLPAVPEPGDVTIVPREVIDALDTYTAPRMVRYTCGTLYGGGWDSGYGYVDGHAGGCGGLGCGGDAGRSADDTGATMVMSAGGTGGLEAALDSVDVEATFAVGDYEIVLLSAEESRGLMLWLEHEGYGAPEGGEALLQEYIDAGVYFFAVKVSLEAEPDGEFLEPLQIRYADEAGTWMLPTRLGALNASGRQELTVFTLTYDEGFTRVVNLPEHEGADDCMPVQEDGETLDQFYGRWLNDTFDGEDGWTTEYAWPVFQKCDPCPPGQVEPPYDDIEDLGIDPMAAYVTRLRIRFDAATAEDLQLQGTGDVVMQEQVRFVEYLEELEADFPICMDGYVADGGSCPDSPTRAGPPPSGGRSGFWGGLLLLAFGVGARRFRS